MVRSGTQQQSIINLVLKMYDDVKDLENKLTSTLGEEIGTITNVTELLNDHIKYNSSLKTLLGMIKEALGKAVMPSDITKTIDSGGPLFIQKDAKTIARSKGWSIKQFQDFSKLRNETISIWKKIDENVDNATAEESLTALNEDISD